MEDYIDPKQIEGVQPSVEIKFQLQDINYIVVKSSSEMEKTYETLYSQFDENEVRRSIQNGSLIVLPLENILSDL